MEIREWQDVTDRCRAEENAKKQCQDKKYCCKKEGADASAPAFHMKKIYEYKSEVSLCCWEDLAVKQGYEKDLPRNY